MRIGRRSFIWGMAMAGSVPTLANAMLPFWSRSSRTALPSSQLAQRPRVGGADVGGWVFKIDGWERPDIAELGGREIVSADSGPDAVLNQQVWIGVNQAWRANWR